MKKSLFIILTLLFILILTTCVSAKSLEFVIGSKTLTVASPTMQTFELDSAPYIENGRTMVPVRVIAENFGADVKWNAEERAVYITAGETNIVLPIGSSTAKINGEDVPLDVPASIASARTFVPLRFVSETLGYKVSYIDALKSVYITNNDPVITINNKEYNIDDFLSFIVLFNDSTNADDVSTLIDSLPVAMCGFTVLSDKYDQSGKTIEHIDNYNEAFSALTEDLRNTLLLSRFYSVSLILHKAELYLQDTYGNTEMSDEELSKIFLEAVAEASVTQQMSNDQLINLLLS